MVPAGEYEHSWGLDRVYNDGFISCSTLGGDRFRLTPSGWIKACCLLRDEVGLDRRFGEFSAHLKGLTPNRTELWVITSTQSIAEVTGLPELWVSDAIEGCMAEVIYRQHGAKLANSMGGVEVPANVGNPL